MDEVAEFFGVSPTAVRRDWKRQGMPGEKGSYPLDQIAQWRCDRIRQAAVKPESSELSKRHDVASLLKLETEAKLKYMRLKQEEVELVERSKIMAEIEEMFHRVRARIEQAPQEVATSIPPETRAQTVADLRHKFALILREMEGWSYD